MTKQTTIVYTFSYLIYQLGIRVYGLLIFCAGWFNEKAQKLYKGQQLAFDHLTAMIQGNDPYVWFHAASLGEFEQGRPIIEALKKEDPTIKILLTFFSPSGYEVRKNYAGADVICYLPLDTKHNANRFLKTINISKAIFIKYEFWPNYLISLHQKNIPVYAVSAIFRPEQAFFQWYGGWYKSLLQSFEQIFVQDQDSKELLNKHDIQQATVAGDTRFDRVSDLAKQARRIPIIESFVQDCKRVIIAGSSWPKDEELLIRYLKNHPDTKLILVPHEIHASHIEGIVKLTGENYVRYTEAMDKIISTERCLIVDIIGLLSAIYRYGQVAYIGGGFGTGIHNTLEAAVWNVPVVFGPNFQRFREARELIAIDGGFSINNYDEMEDAFDKLLDNNAAGKIAGDFVLRNSGATEIILQLLK